MESLATGAEFRDRLWPPQQKQSDDRPLRGGEPEGLVDDVAILGCAFAVGGVDNTDQFLGLERLQGGLDERLGIVDHRKPTG